MKQLFEAFGGLKVLIAGDVMVDRYLSGSVSRISPEAPVPVVQLAKVENRLGGAANVALNVNALGAQPFLLSTLGADEAGAVFDRLLPEHGLRTDGILCSRERKTTVKTRILAASQQLLRVDSEDSHDLSAAEAGALLDRFRSLLDAHEIKVILLQDYNKGVLSAGVIADMLVEAQLRGIPVAVDPKRQNFWAYQGVSLFKPNLKEVRDSVPFAVEPTLASLRQTSAYLRERLNNRITFITLSDKGIFYDDGAEAAILPTQPRSIADVSGAGDTVISVAALGLALGLPLHDIALLSNLAGGQVCEKVGVAPVDIAQLKKEYADFLALK